MSTHTALATPRPCVGRHWSASIVLTMIIAAFGSQVAAQIRPVDLGTLGGQSSFAVALNASGQVVGSSQ